MAKNRVFSIAAASTAAASRHPRLFPTPAGAGRQHGGGHGVDAWGGVARASILTACVGSDSPG